MKLLNQLSILSLALSFSSSNLVFAQDDIFDIDDSFIEQNRIDGFLKLHRLLEEKEKKAPKVEVKKYAKDVIQLKQFDYAKVLIRPNTIIQNIKTLKQFRTIGKSYVYVYKGYSPSKRTFILDKNFKPVYAVKFDDIVHVQDVIERDPKPRKFKEYPVKISASRDVINHSHEILALGVYSSPKYIETFGAGEVGQYTFMPSFEYRYNYEINYLVNVSPTLTIQFSDINGTTQNFRENRFMFGANVGLNTKYGFSIFSGLGKDYSHTVKSRTENLEKEFSTEYFQLGIEFPFRAFEHNFEFKGFVRREWSNTQEESDEGRSFITDGLGLGIGYKL